MPVKPIPEGYNSVTPYLSLKGASAAIEFYKEAFGAMEMFRLPMPNGDIGHAEIKIGDSNIMLADDCAEGGMHNPKALSGSTVGLMLYVEDVDATYAKAISLGAKEIRPVQDQFYGDRTGTLEDPYGHIWFIGTHIEDLTPEEIDKRAQAMFVDGAE